MKGYFARKPERIENLKRAQGWGEPQPIKVIAEVTLPNTEYNRFKNNLQESYDFIRQHTKDTGVMDGFFRSILVRKEGTKHTGIAVQSDGYDYARYAALLRF